MAVVDMYRSTVSWYVPGAGTETDDGDYIDGEGSWSDGYDEVRSDDNAAVLADDANPFFWDYSGESLACEAVPASGEAEERTFEDGVTRRYAFTLYLRPDCREFAIDERVRLTRQGKSYNLKVKGFMRYQHQAKVWIG